MTAQERSKAMFDLWYEDHIGDENKPVKAAAWEVWQHLYQPLARTPLSEKQVEDLIYAKHFRKGCDQLSYSSTQVNLNWYRLGLRDGERVHGITQEQG